MTSRRHSISRGFLILLAVIAVYRLSLLDRGALALVDETWYFKSVMTLDSLRAGDLHGAAHHVSTMLARPGANVIRLPVAALQAIPLAFGVPPSNRGRCSSRRSPTSRSRWSPSMSFSTSPWS